LYRGLNAVELGHLDIHQDNIKDTLTHRVDGFDYRFSTTVTVFVSGLPQQRQRELLIDLVVLGEKKRAAER